MTEITNVNNQTLQGPPGLSGNQDISKDAFLQMLITQLKNQDPMQPMESQEFASQLAQFSSLESLNSIDTNVLEGVTADYVLTQSINNTMATTLIGRNATVSGNNFQYDENGADLQFRLGDDAKIVTVTIRDENGNIVRTEEISNLELGNNTYLWDGSDSDGNEVGADTYTFSIQAENANGEAVQSNTYTVGNISSVRYENGVAILVINGQEYGLEDVIEVAV